MSRDADVRDDWWHLLLLTPIAVPVGFQFGTVGAVFALATILAYPLALYKDSVYVTSVASGWRPNPRLYGIVGLLVLCTAGLLSYVVSPVYLYRRHKHT